jgi:uncharacterized membrane protein YheB (UPF0754 family)
MQIPPSSSSSVEQTILELAKFIASGIVGSFLTWLNLRKKLNPESQQIEASTAKTYAEARHLNGETLKDAYDRIEELYIIADSQRTQIARLQREYDRQVLNEEFLEEELQWMNSVIKTAGVKLENYGHMRQRIRPRPETVTDESTKS